MTFLTHSANYESFVYLYEYTGTDSTTDTAEGLNDSETEITVGDGSFWSSITPNNRYIKLNDGTDEYMEIISRSVNDLTVVRGALGSEAVSHGTIKSIYYIECIEFDTDHDMIRNATYTPTSWTGSTVNRMRQSAPKNVVTGATGRAFQGSFTLQFDTDNVENYKSYREELENWQENATTLYLYSDFYHGNAEDHDDRMICEIPTGGLGISQGSGIDKYDIGIQLQEVDI